MVVESTSKMLLGTLLHVSKVCSEKTSCGLQSVSSKWNLKEFGLFTSADWKPTGPVRSSEGLKIVI